MKPKALIVAALLMMGVSGMTAQVLLLRELLVSYLGNELTLGVILANWLLLEGFGSFIFLKWIKKEKNNLNTFVLLQIFFAMALPFAVFLARIFKNVLLSVPGEGLGLASIFFSSFLILLPIAVSHGALFPYGSQLYAAFTRKAASPAGKVYLLETIGSILAGLLMTFVLIHYFHSFQIAFLISLLNTVISGFLLWPNKKIPSSPLRLFLLLLSALLSFLFAWSLLGPAADRIQQASIRSQWKPLNVVHNENSVYGNICLTRRNEQYTFFVNGVPSVTTPIPDITAVENFVHFSMLFSRHPETILVVSGGAGGMIHEILKYPVRQMDYVELDPLLLKLIQQYPTPLTQSVLSDQRVRIHYTDGRLFVKETDKRFDVIFVGLAAPQELQMNRFFSSEFFSLARKKMTPEGILALNLPGSSTYISPELRDLNGCILNTLKSVFQSVRIVPGDTNLYLASDSSLLDEITAQDLVKRFKSRKVKTKLFSTSYLTYRLHPRWTKWFFDSMEGGKKQINSDLRPVEVFLTLSYWNALFSPYLKEVFNGFEGFSLRNSSAVILLLTFLLAIFFIKKPRFSRQSIPYAVFTTGLAGMIFNLAVIFTFQTRYGCLYQQIGLLIAVFMSGLALSGYIMIQYLKQSKRNIFLFFKIEAGIVLFSFLFPLTFSMLFPILETTAFQFLIYPLFLILAFLSGSGIGLQFPLATKLYPKYSSKILGSGQTAGLLYGVDLWGGFLGGLFGGILLLPVLGLLNSCFLTGMIKISSGILFFIFMKQQNRV